MKDIKNRRKRILKKIFDFFEIILTLIIIIICLMILIQRLSNNEKSFFGYRLFKVETGSMIPVYNINDVLLVKEVELNSINVGDDLVYKTTENDYKEMIITHRVVEIKQKEDELIFYTKGIANQTKDPAVYTSQVMGVVQYKVHTLTLITNVLLNIYGLYFVIILPIIITIFFSAIHSQEKREKYLEKRIKEEKKELEKNIKHEEKLNNKKNKNLNNTEKRNTKK